MNRNHHSNEGGSTMNLHQEEKAISVQELIQQKNLKVKIK